MSTDFNILMPFLIVQTINNLSNDFEEWSFKKLYDIVDFLYTVKYICIWFVQWDYVGKDHMMK